MRKYGSCAVKAARLAANGAVRPGDAWNRASEDEFPPGRAAQMKSCPRCAFLGLCREGLVKEVSKGSYTRSKDNAHYAVQAVSLLRDNPRLATEDEKTLWLMVIGTETKQHNQQMDVVLALWNAGLIV